LQTGEAARNKDVTGECTSKLPHIYLLHLISQPPLYSSSTRSTTSLKLTSFWWELMNGYNSGRVFSDLRFHPSHHQQRSPRITPSTCLLWVRVSRLYVSLATSNVPAASLPGTLRIASNLAMRAAFHFNYYAALQRRLDYFFARHYLCLVWSELLLLVSNLCNFPLFKLRETPPNFSKE
jgi:hypothetical protein